MLEKYIDKIKNKDVQVNIREAYESLPEYFHKVAASSTGKYHPKFSLGDGGLVRHTQCALDVAVEIFRITNSIDELGRDIVIGSLILHDGLKYGLNNSPHTVKKHDDIMADWLIDFWKKVDFPGKTEIIKCIKSHMGQWATSSPPKTKLQRFVHFCDYIASRKFWDSYYKD